MDERTRGLARLHRAAVSRAAVELDPSWYDALSAALVADDIAVGLADLVTALGDPAARVVAAGQPPVDGSLAPGTSDPAQIQDPVAVVDGTAVVTVAAVAGLAATRTLGAVLDDAFSRASAASAVVLDLRGAPLHLALQLSQRCADLLGRDITLPDVETLVRTSPPGTPAAVLTSRGATYLASGPGRALTVLVGPDGFGMELGLALQARGARLVQHGTVSPSPVPRLRIAVVDGHSVEFAVARIAGGARPDHVVPSTEEPVAAALTGLPATMPPPARRAVGGRRDHGLAAAVRLHAALAEWWPYHHLLDQRWDEALELADACRGQLGLDLGLSLNRLLTRCHDGHALVSSPNVMAWAGSHRPDARVAWIDDEPVVTSSADPGLRAGDVVVMVDGVAAADRLADLRRHLPASTEHGRHWRACGSLLGGAQGTTAIVDVIGADGAQRQVHATRTVAGPVGPHAARDVVTQLAEGTVIDLGRLLPHEVESALDSAQTALILDLRRYPRSTGALVAGRLTDRPVVAARLRTRWPGGSVGQQDPNWHPWAVEQVMEQVLHPTGSRVDVPVTLLVDEGTISQGEHTALFVLAARPDARIFGSPTNGTNGAVTSVSLGLDLTAVFTGYDVAWPDGRPLQRRGVQPTHPVRPTRAGLAAGRDEVLEAALCAE